MLANPAPVPPLPPPVVPGGGFSLAFRDPEAFILRWHREGHPYSLGIFAGLALVAVLGTLGYGLLLARNTSPDELLRAAGLNCLAAAIAWAVPLPAVYILNSMTGMRLRASTTFLASLVSAAWGGFAFLAFLPIALIYLLTFPQSKALALFGHLLVFALVGLSMAMIFGRQIERLEPRHGGGRVWWLWLFVCLEVQLLYSFKLLSFEF